MSTAPKVLTAVEKIELFLCIKSLVLFDTPKYGVIGESTKTRPDIIVRSVEVKQCP